MEHLIGMIILFSLFALLFCMGFIIGSRMSLGGGGDYRKMIKYIRTGLESYYRKVYGKD